MASKKTSSKKTTTEKKEDPWKGISASSKNYFMSDPQGQALLAAAGGDPRVAMSGYGGLQLSQAGIGDAFKPIDASPEEGKISGDADALRGSADLMGSDITKAQGDTDMNRGELGSALEGIKTAGAEDPRFAGFWSDLEKQRAEVSQVDPTTRGVLADMLARTNGYTPQEWAAARSAQDQVAAQAARAAQRNTMGALGSRGVGGGALASALSNIGAQSAQARMANEAKLTMDSGTLGRDMLNKAGTLSNTAYGDAANRGIGVSNTLQNALQAEGARQQTDRANWNTRVNNASGNLTNSNNVLGNLYGTQGGMRTNAASLSNTVAGMQNNRNTYNNEQGTNKYLAQYGGALQGLATGANLLGLKNSTDYQTGYLKYLQSTAGKSNSTPPPTIVSMNYNYPAATTTKTGAV
jgi:hypothetical protein